MCDNMCGTRNEPPCEKRLVVHYVRKVWHSIRWAITARVWAVDALMVEIGIEEAIDQASFHVARGIRVMLFGSRRPIQEHHFRKPVDALASLIQLPPLPRFLCNADLIACAVTLYV